MMLTGGDLRVSLVTIHLPISEVSAHLTTQRIVMTAKITARALVRDLALANPRIAIAGLNPHAGEAGALGQEERDVIAPAVRLLADSGLHVTGPHPADTLFHPEARRAYDVVIADIRLPDMTGYELLVKLREIIDSVPMVLMTGFGYDPGHSIVKARQAGIDLVLFKPFRVDQLLDTVERALAAPKAV